MCWDSMGILINVFPRVRQAPSFLDFYPPESYF